MAEFAYRRMECYQAARVVARDVRKAVTAVPRQYWYAADQLLRAMLSVMLNLAEGAGEFRPREKARFCRMSRRSAFEAAAAVEHLNDLSLVEDATAESLISSLERIAASLTMLIKSMEQRARYR